MQIKEQVETHGYGIAAGCISAASIKRLADAVDDHAHGVRNLLTNVVIREFAKSDELRAPVVAALGKGWFAVRGIFFNKNSRANWKVSWHQDTVIAVRNRGDIAGWGPWSTKAGVIHVRPAGEVLEQMIAIRIHLDDCRSDNGPLRVVPGSHRRGVLSDREIQDWPKNAAVTCAVHGGDAILMRPLLLHASSPSSQPSNRRVIHLEFAAHELPGGVEWNDRV
jgi:hypothetical protein